MTTNQATQRPRRELKATSAWLLVGGMLVIWLAVVFHHYVETTSQWFGVSGFVFLAFQSFVIWVFAGDRTRQDRCRKAVVLLFTTVLFIVFTVWGYSPELCGAQGCACTAATFDLKDCIFAAVSFTIAAILAAVFDDVPSPQSRR